MHCTKRKHTLEPLEKRVREITCEAAEGEDKGAKEKEVRVADKKAKQQKKKGTNIVALKAQRLRGDEWRQVQQNIDVDEIAKKGRIQFR